MKALEESNWFVSIEREGLSNLLNERKIIRSSRQNYEQTTGDTQPDLPPLLFAGVILEGGIISYDSNILTGGVGLKYFGVGGSNQYREDRITIYLRAISTSNGRVLKTVYTSKRILSQMVDVGLFRYVEFKRLLETEGGYSYNEPLEICVSEAIQKSVHSLIIEGIKDGLWQLKNQEDIASKVILDYEKEKEESFDNDYFNRDQLAQRPKLGLSLSFGRMLYSGDFGKQKFSYGGDGYLKYSIDPSFTVLGGLSYGRLSSSNLFDADIFAYELQTSYYFDPYSRFSPILRSGVAFYNRNLIPISASSIKPIYDYSWKVSGGIGAEYRLYELLSVDVNADFNYMLTDDLDGFNGGDMNDYFWSFKIGFSFYPNIKF
ncbi:MAG: outer membrane beta-barrel protein [Ignavibacteriales bacterium]|nr:outer membrane beta-barrel protein [Ignavibacteriales bacterium]